MVLQKDKFVLKSEPFRVSRVNLEAEQKKSTLLILGMGIWSYEL